MKVIFLLLLSTVSTITIAQTTVVIHSLDGYQGNEAFAKQSAARLQEVINSEAFKTAIRTGRFKKKNGLTNEEIYFLILKAHEVQGRGGEDNVIDLRLRTITKEIDGDRWIKNCELNSAAQTIGIDGLGDGVNAICPQRLQLWANSNNTAELVGHYMHEYMHILGFSHGGWGKRRSAVYKIGNVVSDLIATPEMASLQ